jgi:hypothetical protein
MRLFSPNSPKTASKNRLNLILRFAAANSRRSITEAEESNGRREKW